MLVHPALTTVLNPAYETGGVAARFLLDRMTGTVGAERRSTNLPCKLIVRGTA